MADTAHNDTLALDDLQAPLATQQTRKSSNFGGTGHEKGWYEVKMTGKLPERRSYHVSFIHNEAFYVFGGQDLKEGTYNSLWKLPIKIIMEGGSTNWEEVISSGEIPPPIAHHCGVVNGNNLYVYGGMINSDSNQKVYALNLNNLQWSIVQPATEVTPKGRDDHSSCSDGSNLYVFGGYVDGGKANDLWKFTFENSTWTQIDQGDDGNVGVKHYNPNLRPCPRIGASLTHHMGALYLLGGHDLSNEKLDDFWKFDIASNKWSPIETSGHKPSGRNGHTAVVINNKLIVFGGILEVTKESDEIFIYDYATQKWSILELYYSKANDGSPIHGVNRTGEHENVISDNYNTHKKEQAHNSNPSTLKKNKNTSSMPNLKPNLDLTLNKQSSMNLNSSLALTGGDKNDQRGGSLTRKPTVGVDQQFVKYMRGQQVLSSPTSIQMKNAFILKNTNASFEHYFQAMKKRKNGKLGQSTTLSQSIEYPRSIHILKNKPSARDGHSSFVYNNRMFIFGGDRHHMPFNDIFFLDIEL